MGQMPESDDHRLLAEFVRDRSETAFTELVRRYAGLVHSTAFRFCGNAHHAEEITQAVFVILARKAETLSPRVVVSGWLYQTARLTAANFVKGEMRRRRREQEAVMQSNLLETDPTDWGKIAPLLDDAMGALGETDRNAVLLRYFENRTSSEIGVALRMNEETARKRVNRALEKLRHFFAERGVTVSSAALSGAISANSIQPISAFMVKSISALALAKGAAASTSTLTLIKGALKIMAWTKAKTAIVVGVVALLAVGTATVTIKEIAAHEAEASWRVPNPDANRAPLLVKILPTKFPKSVGSLNVGRRGDNWVGVGQPVFEIARVAYGWRPGRIIFTGTQPRERYDFISTLPKKSGIALQAEFKKQLGFVGHREMRDTDVLVLKVRRPNAAGLKPPTGGGSDYSNNGYYHCDNSPLSSDSGWYPGISRFLEDYFEMPIIDQTGLIQNFCIDLRWNEQFGGDPSHDALKKALLDQLGLELVPANLPVEMLVVEKAK
jgi:uncharacterized protein (TIGR03435 family)